MSWISSHIGLVRLVDAVSMAPLGGVWGSWWTVPQVSQSFLFKNRGDNLTKECKVFVRCEGGIDDSEQVIHAPDVHTFVGILCLLTVAHCSDDRYKVSSIDVAEVRGNGIYFVIASTNLLAVKVKIALALQVIVLGINLKQVINLALATVNVEQNRFFDQVVCFTVANHLIPETLNPLTKCNQNRLGRDTVIETKCLQDVRFSLLWFNRENQGQQVGFEVGGHGLFADVVSLQGQRAIRSPVVYSA